MKNTMTNTDKTVSEEFKERIRKESINAKIISLAPTVLFVILLVLFAIFAPGFASIQNLYTLLNQISIPLIIATGTTFVLIIGSIDLSIDGVTSLVVAVVSILVLNSYTGMDLGILGCIIAILVGGVCGCITGIVFVKGKIPSFMVTFAMSSICYGVGWVLYAEGGIPPRINDELVRSIGLSDIAGLPIYFYIALVLFLIALFVQEKTIFGKHLYAVGENETLARQAGIYVEKLKIIVFVIAGLFVGVAAVCITAQIGQGDVTLGNGLSFPAIAAVVVGGTSLSGGKGGVLRTLLGVAIITVLSNGLVCFGAKPEIKDALVGVILILAVIVASTRKSKTIVK